MLLIAINFDDKKHMNLEVGADDSRNNEIEADNIFENYKKNNWFIRYFNYRSGILQLYDNLSGRTIKRKITPKSMCPVDKDILNVAIEVVGNEYENGQLPPMYFSLIYKLLVDEVLGAGYKDLTATSFMDMMAKNGFTTEKRSSFSKYTPKGKFPDWYYQKPFKRNKEKRKKDALDFAQKFKTVYDDLKQQIKKNEMIETEEETAE